MTQTSLATRLTANQQNKTMGLARICKNIIIMITYHNNQATHVIKVIMHNYNHHQYFVTSFIMHI